MIYPLSIRRENEFLASAFGSVDGQPRFQWRWGADVQAVVPVLDDDGNPRMDIHCACGVNVAVHTHKSCNWSTGAPRREVICVAPNQASQWVMTVRLPSVMCLDADHCYVPVGDPQKTIAIIPGLAPTRDDTILVMAALTEHYSKSAAQRMAEMKEADAQKWAVSDDRNPDKPMGQLQQQYYDQLKSEFPVGLKDEFGRTTQFHGQTGVGDSPTPKKLVTLD